MWAYADEHVLSDALSKIVLNFNGIILTFTVLDAQLPRWTLL